MTGALLHDRVRRCFPHRRSLTGDGVRATLADLGEGLPLQVTEVPTGTRVLDWVVPDEWSVREAHVSGPDGRRVVDWAQDPLALVGYSVPFRGTLTREELDAHLHSLPDRPGLVPYRTSYYEPAWGFCLPDAVRRALPPGQYAVVVDTVLAPGALTLGEVVVPGRTDDVVLVSAHVCHPGQADDNLSGAVLAAALAGELLTGELLAGEPPRLTYRFLFGPGTLGAIAWLHLHREDVVPSVRHGLVISGAGGPLPLSYKRSRRGDATVDRAAAHVLRHLDPDARLLPFTPYGYDERQFCSPGFDLPVGRLGRGVHGQYPQYHTCADDLAFVTPEALEGSLEALRRVVAVLEHDRVLVSTAPFGEPQLGRRGLYRGTGAAPLHAASAEMALLWVLNLADGRHSLLDVAERAQLPFDAVHEAAERLLAVGLLRPAG